MAEAAPTRDVPATGAGVERRLVSVLFADLVGHTVRSEQQDVEDVRELLTRYFDVARTIVERYGGEIEKFIGDAVMAVWGTPTAREDDAERAVRAALDLVPAVAALGRTSAGDALAVRAAVLTGEAAVTLGARGQGMVAGDLVNTASRVQSLAQPGTVLAGEATRRATEAAISYADAGLHELKGKAEQVPLWKALRVTAGRGGSLRSEIFEPPFVGRERELRLLKELFHASADESKAHVVSIVGIAGIGKSRLARELEKYFDGLIQRVRWHRGRCLAYGEGVSFWALAEMVRMRLEIAEGEEPESARYKLAAGLERYVQDQAEREWIEPRLAQLLALGEREFPEGTDLFAGWRLFLERLSERDPVVLVLEDMQWADAPLLEFLEYLLDWSRNHRLFVLVLARPELVERHPEWGRSIRNTTTLSLEPLSREAMEELLAGLVPGLPDEIRRQVLDRAEGVPLYAVESVRMLLDRGLLERHGDEYRPTGAIEALAVPETLHALVAARLDDLTDDERRLLQDASVVGKTFARDALAAVTVLQADRLDLLLASLTRKEILALDADPRSPERGQYAFLQDLLRQVAYETMPRVERKARHLAAAAHLERELRDTEHELAAIVASHYLTALELAPAADGADEIAAKARATLVKAGERAASLAANESAQRYFEQALELTEGPLERAELHEQAGRMAVLGLRAEAARSHFESAIAGFDGLRLPSAAARVTARLGILIWKQENDIARAIDEMERAFHALADERDADLATLAVQLARPLYFAGRLDEAMARNELALEIGEALCLTEVLSQGFNTKGLIMSSRGRHDEAELLLRHSLELALEHDLSESVLRAYGNLTAVVGRDRIREAMQLAQAGVELARKLGDPSGEVWLGGMVRFCKWAIGDWDAAAMAWEDAERLNEVGFATMQVTIWLHRGDSDEVDRWLHAAREDIDVREVQLLSALRTAESEVLLARGAPQEALEAAEEALGVQDEVAGGLAASIPALVAALEAAFAVGGEAKVDELLGLLDELPPGELTPALRAIRTRFGARRTALRGDDEAANAGFRAAADLLREIEWPFQLAGVLLEHAEWVADGGRNNDARPLLEEAREIFERLRATPWLERVDRATIGVGAPVALE